MRPVPHALQMSRQPILPVSQARRGREARRAAEIDAAEKLGRRTSLRVIVECVALTLLGTPFYAWSWHLTDPDRAAIWAALGFAVSYAGPFFRWLLYHTRNSETFN